MLHLLLIITLLQPAAPVPENLKFETDLTRYYAKVVFEKNYELEYVLPDGRRVDILTETHAYESERIEKMYEGIGQALSYAISTNKKPGLFILYKNGQDEKYNQLLAIVTSLRGHGYDLELIIINIDNGKIWRH